MYNESSSLKKFPKGNWKKMLKGKTLGVMDETSTLVTAKHVEHEEEHAH